MGPAALSSHTEQQQVQSIWKHVQWTRFGRCTSKSSMSLIWPGITDQRKLSKTTLSSLPSVT